MEGGAALWYQRATASKIRRFPLLYAGCRCGTGKSGEVKNRMVWYGEKARENVVHVSLLVSTRRFCRRWERHFNVYFLNGLVAAPFAAL